MEGIRVCLCRAAYVASSLHHETCTVSYAVANTCLLNKTIVDEKVDAFSDWMNM